MKPNDEVPEGAWISLFVRAVQLRHDVTLGLLS